MIKSIEQEKLEFSQEFHKLTNTGSVKQVQEFLLSSVFNKFSDQYKQSVMDHLVCLGYKKPDLAKWALTNSVFGVIGNIHEKTDRPLRMACEFNPEFAKYLLTSPELTQKADINATNDGSSALLNAIHVNNLDLIKYLITSNELEVKAKIDIADKEFNDPLCKACTKNHTTVVKYLLSDECYPNKEVFNAKINLARFDYACVYKIINNGNLDLLKFIVDNKLIDVIKNKELLTNMFCKAIISDSRQAANYLESFFNEKIDITNLPYKNTKLFLAVAKHCHYGRITNHSYLHEMLDQMSLTLSAHELKEINDFYIYKKNGSAQKLLDIIEVYQEKVKVGQNLISKKIKKEIHKI